MKTCILNMSIMIAGLHFVQMLIDMEVLNIISQSAIEIQCIREKFEALQKEESLLAEINLLLHDQRMNHKVCYLIRWLNK